MLPKSTFFHENFVAVLGVALPLLLVVFFSLARGFSDATVAPPEYQAVYAQAQRYYGEFHYSVGPDKKLVVTYIAPHYNGAPQPMPMSTSTTVFVSDAKTGKVSQHLYMVANAYTEGSTVVTSSDQAITVESEGTNAPDGYAYSHNNENYSGGIIPEIFGYNRRYDNSHVISKGGRSFPLGSVNSYDNIDFIGWTRN